MKNLIINADDFGFDVDRDLGIVFLASTKCISSISVIVTNQKSYRRIKKLIKLVKFLSPSVTVGLHLNLTDCKLLTCRQEDICDISKIYDNPKITFWYHTTKNTYNITNIKMEIKKQIDLFYKLFNFYPHHIDGHNHCHISNTEIFNKLIEIANIYNIRNVRFPNEKLNDYKLAKINKDYKNFLLHNLKPEFLAPRMMTNPLYDIYLYRNCCININSSISHIEFLGTVYGHIRTYKFLTESIKDACDNNTYELMVHPGFYCPFIFKHSVPFSNIERLQELINLIKLKFLHKNYKINLINQFKKPL
ncbi:ChbG/HpnK family deacetylase [Mammaliicoccus sp. I-M36]|uniref:ChbG/HpnK family deacetylase n=1 Tax=Mammaliicoccus sp. I-M36 TaxID=2898695 RepID=UPI001EFC24ED|nr:ChbG/HpnK family deacetylase [Mammaliicoccus sp. I-M36]